MIISIDLHLDSHKVFQLKGKTKNNTDFLDGVYT